jgi:hypothetical protein
MRIDCGRQAAEQSDVRTGCADAHVAKSADGCDSEDPKGHSRTEQEEVAHAYGRWVLCNERAQCLGRRKGGYKRRSMSERRSCSDTGREKQYVNRREQNQRWTTELRGRFHNKIIYKQNE